MSPSDTSCVMTVDGTDCRIQEPTTFNPIWYSHKFKGPGLRYEIAISIAKGHIVWVNGPYPCGSHPDVKIFRDCLKSHLLPGEVVLADRGYTDERCVSIAPGKDLRTSSLLRARHETLNGRIKSFKATGDVFRHSKSKHSVVFHAVAKLCQLSIMNGNELFSV